MHDAVFESSGHADHEPLTRIQCGEISRARWRQGEDRGSEAVKLNAQVVVNLEVACRVYAAPAVDRY